MTYVPLKEQWLLDRLEAAGYTTVIILSYFGGRGAVRSYAFTCPPELRGRRTLSAAEAKREVGANSEEVK